MKVGTDAMLLGSWIDPRISSSILDVGTGCGVMALMMAQVSNAQVDAIDIHLPSVEEAKKNISRSPWAERINVFHRPVEEHSRLAGKLYDLIISNPPFFSNSLKPSSARKLIAKHEQALSLGTLLDSSLKLMHPGSSFCLILPVREGKLFISMTKNSGLYPVRILMVRPLPSKTHNRMLIEFSFRKKIQVIEDELIIRTDVNVYSKEYLFMTQQFHYFHR